jgi:hypothetical protein
MVTYLIIFLTLSATAIYGLQGDKPRSAENE